MKKVLVTANLAEGVEALKPQGDYSFKGLAVPFLKRSGSLRWLVENDAGIVHILHERQLDFGNTYPVLVGTPAEHEALMRAMGASDARPVMVDEVVHSLILKAASVVSGDEAMKLSQAALNAANAVRALNDIKISQKVKP